MEDFPPSSSSTFSKKCLVCGEESDGSHFGASTCRACAAFFRRTVQLNKTHTCFRKEQCSLDSNVRVLCRFCRFQKCISIGMDPMSVQRKRDQLGKRDMIEPNFENQKFSVIDNVHKAYKILENERKLVHDRKQGQSGIAITFTELKAVYIREMSVVYAFLCNSFPEYSKCSPDMKRSMFKNFFLPFRLIESTFFGYIKDRPDLMILPSGDYVDLSDIGSFYIEEDNFLTKEENAQHVIRQGEMLKTCLFNPMKEENIDILEFLAIVALLLWERDIEIEYDKNLNEVDFLKMRDGIVRDILSHYNSDKKYADPALRLAKILSFLPMIQRCTHKFQEFVEMKHLFNVYTLPKKLYDMFTPTT